MLGPDPLCRGSHGLDWAFAVPPAETSRGLLGSVELAATLSAKATTQRSPRYLYYSHSPATAGSTRATVQSSSSVDKVGNSHPPVPPANCSREDGGGQTMTRQRNQESRDLWRCRKHRRRGRRGPELPCASTLDSWAGSSIAYTWQVSELVGTPLTAGSSRLRGWWTYSGG